MGSLVLVQTHRFQGRTYRSFSWGEDRTNQKHLNMFEDSFGEKWREGSQNPYHFGWWGTHISFKSFDGSVTRVPYPLLPQMAEDQRSEERRVGKECRSRWSPYH